VHIPSRCVLTPFDRLTGWRYMVAKTSRYAVTVSREDGEFLFFDIRRKPPSDIYINLPKLHGGPKDWEPHTSMHASGAFHHKDFGVNFMPRQISKPDVSFVGSENLISLGINPEQWRSIKKTFDPKPFVGKFPIDVKQLWLDNRRAQLHIDIVQPNCQPKLIPGRVLQQAFFSNGVPWVALTLIEPAGF
jgi:hypothetical protein